MKKKMFFLIVTIYSLTLFSCGDENQTTQNNKNDVNYLLLSSNNCFNDYTLDQFIDSAGIYHNKCLDAMLINLQEYKDTITPLPLNLTWRTFTYNKANSFFSDNCTNLNETVDLNSVVDADIDIKTLTDSSDLSNEAKNIMYSLDSVLNTNVSNGDKILHINNLISNSKLIADSTEKIICGVSCSVAKSSLIYWSSNKLLEWEELLNINTSTSNKNNKIADSPFKHAAADAAGALKGGLSAGRAVFLAGPQAYITIGLMGGVVGACIGSAKSIQAGKAGWGWLDYIPYP